MPPKIFIAPLNFEPLFWGCYSNDFLGPSFMYLFLFLGVICVFLHGWFFSIANFCLGQFLFHGWFPFKGVIQNNKHVALANHKSFNGRSIRIKNNQKSKRNVSFRNPSSIGVPFPNVNCSHLLKIPSTRLNEWKGHIEIHKNCNQALVWILMNIKF